MAKSHELAVARDAAKEKLTVADLERQAVEMLAIIELAHRIAAKRNAMIPPEPVGGDVSIAGLVIGSGIGNRMGGIYERQANAAAIKLHEEHLGGRCEPCNKRWRQGR